MPGESKSSPRRIVAKEKQKRALQLRMAGATFAQIAETMGLPHASSAYDCIMRAMSHIPEPEAKLYKKLNLERLNRLLMALWQTAIAERPDRRDIAQCLSIIAEMNKLVGAYEPDRVSMTFVHDMAQKIADAEGVPVSEVMEEAKRIAEEHWK